MSVPRARMVTPLSAVGRQRPRARIRHCASAPIIDASSAPAATMASPRNPAPDSRRHDSPARDQQRRATQQLSAALGQHRLQVLQGLDAGRGDDVDALVRPARFDLGDPGARPRPGARADRPRASRPSCRCATKVSFSNSRPPSPRTISTRAPLVSCNCGCASSASLVKPASGTMSAASSAAASAAAVARPIAAMRVRRLLVDQAGAMLDRVDADEDDQIVVDRRDVACAATGSISTAGKAIALPPCRSISAHSTAALRSRSRDQHRESVSGGTIFGITAARVSASRAARGAGVEQPVRECRADCLDVGDCAAVHAAIDLAVRRASRSRRAVAPARLRCRACPAIGDWQLPCSRSANARSASQHCHASASFSARTSSMLRASSARHSMPMMPWPTAGTNCSRSNVCVMRSSRPRRISPAAASMIASYCSSSSLRSRVSTLPRSVSSCRSGRAYFS